MDQKQADRQTRWAKIQGSTQQEDMLTRKQKQEQNKTNQQRLRGAGRQG